jgi:hypothetical protein
MEKEARKKSASPVVDLPRKAAEFGEDGGIVPPKKSGE